MSSPPGDAPRPPVVADAGYGDTTAFRQGLTERGLTYVVAVKAATSAHPGDAVPVTAPDTGPGPPTCSPLPRTVELQAPRPGRRPDASQR